MSLLDSTDTDGEVPQNCEHNLPSLVWQDIEIDEKKMAALCRVMEKIIKKGSIENLPGQITKAAEVVLEISSGINAIMIPLCPLAPITNPLLFNGYRTTKMIASGL